MANLQKGEVSLPAGEETYTLSFSVNAFCRMEEADGRPFSEILEDLADAKSLTMQKLRWFVHMALSDHHPDLTPDDAGRIIMNAGGIEAVMVAVGKGLAASAPQEASGTPRPPNRAARRAAGTGRNS